MSTTSSHPVDELTGLLTRKAFHEAFDAALERLKGSDTPLSLAFIDIDNFLSINDSFGRSGGDEVLINVADVLRSLAGDTAIVCRYGGDEFSLLSPDTEREQAFLMVEKMRMTLAGREISVPKTGATIAGVSISAGIACSPIDGRLKSELMRKADQALYRAKATGRGKVRLAYDERMLPKTSHYTQTQLERLSKLAAERQAGEAELLREALDDLIAKYGVNEIER